MDDTNLHAPTLRWVANMLESRADTHAEARYAQYEDVQGAIQAMRIIADELNERANGLAKEEPPLSAWIAATEGTGLGEPRIETVRGASMPILIHLRGVIVQLPEPLKPPAFVYTTEGGLSGPTPCASPAELRAALEALVPR